jgi:TonB family protein
MAVTTYQNILLSIAEELGDASVDRAQRFDRIITAWASGFLVQNKRNLAIAGAGTLAVVLGAWVWNSNSIRNGNRAAEDQQTPPLSVAALAVPIRAPAANGDSQLASPALRATVPVVAARGRASEATKRGSDRRESYNVAIPKTFAATMPGVDSAVTAAGAATGSLASSLTPDFGPPPTLAQRSSFVDNGDQANGRGRHARLIGDLPAPILPSSASGMEGEVVVSFTVDAEGRPVASTVAFVKSPDPILSSAVRKVIPALRFDPARSAGPDAERVPETVEITYRFAAAKR